MFLVRLAPSDDGAFGCRKYPSDSRHGLTHAQQSDGLSATAFQLLSASLWSHTREYNYTRANVPLFMRKSIKRSSVLLQALKTKARQSVSVGLCRSSNL